jgi:hypothetical protein
MLSIQNFMNFRSAFLWLLNMCRQTFLLRDLVGLGNVRLGCVRLGCVRLGNVRLMGISQDSTLN